MESLSEGEFCSVNHELRTLTPDEEKVLLRQDSRGLVAGFHQHKLEKEAAKNWDKFYKRNENRFFKDRHWTTREFHELIGSGNSTRTLLEVGCGVGNFVYPLIEDGLNLFIYACDFSPRAVQLVKSDARYDESKIRAFECDITKDDLQSKMDVGVDIISLVFVLSAIHPDKYQDVITNMYRCLKPGGTVLLRDYGVNDMAMLRFGPGTKLGEHFYVRQDGTRAYYFTKEEVNELFTKSGFTALTSHYIHRRTVNKKEGVNVQRVFLQGKFTKPEEG